MKLNLEKYNWYCRRNIYVTGFIRNGEEYLRNSRIADLFSDVYSIQEFERILISVNGQFSVLIIKTDEIWAATDRLRCYPLFYTCVKGEFFISDDCYLCLEKNETKEISQVSKKSFLLAGYVPVNLTLINNIFQVEAGEIVIFGKSVSRKFYHEIASGTIESRNPDSFSIELRDLLHSVFSGHLCALKKRFIVIPLSGGYDSRLTAAMGSIYHPENMLCYTYGRKDNIEALKAAEVAKRLNVKWLNIEYNNELIKDYIKSKPFNDYYPFGSNLSSMFFMQDYFALEYLKERSMVPDNAVFIPGYSGDFVAGSHLTPAMNKCLTENGIADIIFKMHFRYVRLSASENEDIKNLIRQKIPGNMDNHWKIFENWDLKERQAKFIVNSARAFLYFGYEFVMPFWDKNIIDFFSKIPFVLKLNKKLYDTVLRQSVFSDLNLNLDNDHFPGPLSGRIQNIKDSVKSFLPYDLVKMLTDQRNILFYDEITRIMKNDIGSENFVHPRQSNLFNSYIIQWYLYKTAELLKRN